MQTYTGSRATVQIFNNNDTSYLNAFNNQTLKVLADISFTGAPINGATEILDGSIGTDQLADGSVTSAKLAPLTSFPTLANNTYILGTLFGGGSANLIKINTSDYLQAGRSWEALQVGYTKKISGTLSGGGAQDWMKTNTSAQWEFLSDSYVQNQFPKADNTYTYGSSSLAASAIYGYSLYLKDYGFSNPFYATGTFTPAIIGFTSAGSANYSIQDGYYIRIGKFVTVWAHITWTSHTGTGNVTLSGLPTGDALVDAVGTGAVYAADFTYTGTLVMVTAGGGALIEIDQVKTDGSHAQLTVPVAGSLRFSVSYAMS
jgi:hypothetical protein